ncbi:MAG TPA: hypothetical protein VGI60_14205 [Chthoniobacterales bacterium]|jgi:hypothetical protein
MKTFMVLVLTVVALFVWQRGNNPGETSAPNASPKLVATPAPAAASAQSWAKNSIDRTHEAIEQVRRMREEKERP